MGLELFEHVPGLIIVPGGPTQTRTRTLTRTLTRTRTRKLTLTLTLTLIIVPDGSGTRRAGAVDESAISASDSGAPFVDSMLAAIPQLEKVTLTLSLTLPLARTLTPCSSRPSSLP